MEKIKNEDNDNTPSPSLLEDEFSNFTPTTKRRFKNKLNNESKFNFNNDDKESPH